MHFYSIDYEVFLRLPIYTFWALARNVDRIRAEEDRRMVCNIACILSNPSDHLASLKEEKGSVIEAEINEEFDRIGFQRMQALVASKD